MQLILNGAAYEVSDIQVRPHPCVRGEIGTLAPGRDLRELLADDPYKTRRATLVGASESREIELRELSRAPGGRASFVVLSGPHAAAPTPEPAAEPASAPDPEPPPGPDGSADPASADSPSEGEPAPE